MRLLIPLVAALSACASSQRPALTPVRLELPASLEGDRALYQRDIEAALDHVVAWFAKNGLGVDRREILASAVVFADPPAPALAWEQLQALIASDAAKPLTYPFYGQMFRSVAASFPNRELVERAGREGFPAELQRGYRSQAP